ncbi:pyruvate kinase [Pseudothermotoga sp. U03pept]|uniref:pyruvate kinase n=1 Tax=Pseudothermotoga sp. U03pept TaxID=3447012 RepID=UPI003EFD35FB
MRKSKIICTIGPKTEDIEMIKKLIYSGVNAFRLSAVHYKIDKLRELIQKLTELREDMTLPVAIIVDLPGPKLRTGEQKEEFIELIEGEKVFITTEENLSSKGLISVDYPRLAQEIKIDDPVLIDDGKIRLRVTKIFAKRIECVVEVGGRFKKNSGVNLPESELSIPALTDEDKKIISNCAKTGVNFFCLSFVKSAKDVKEARRFIESIEPVAGVLTKIETKKALENIEEICQNSDGIIIARGDLAVEIPIEQLPVAQKKILRVASKYGVPTVVATQILSSMTEDQLPTRPEVIDVANIVFDGADALLFTSETAVGNYPLQVVEMANKIIEDAEEFLKEHEFIFWQRHSEKTEDPSEAIARSCYCIAKETGAKAIITSTASGSTARRVSHFRPFCPIIATTPNQNTFNQLSIVWGVIPILVPEVHSTDIMIHVAVERVKSLGYVESSDTVVVTSGAPCGIVGTTNMLKIHTVE